MEELCAEWLFAELLVQQVAQYGDWEDKSKTQDDILKGLPVK